MQKETLKIARFELKDILEDHCVARFREFLETHSEELPGCKNLKSLKDETLSQLLHTLKARQPYLGEISQESRNALREQQFKQSEQRFQSQVTSEVRAYRQAEGVLPLCAFCQFFRDPPGQDEAPCMHLGGTPYDVACIGWKPIEE